MRPLLDIRVEKVSVNTAFVRSPKFIRKASKESGKERVIVAIHRPRDPPHSGLPGLELVSKSRSGFSGLEIVKRAKPVEELGTAQILFTSKDTDDTKHPYDLEMTEAVVEAVTIGRAAAILAASMFHFGEISIPEAQTYLMGKGTAVRILARRSKCLSANRTQARQQ